MFLFVSSIAVLSDASNAVDLQADVVDLQDVDLSDEFFTEDGTLAVVDKENNDENAVEVKDSPNLNPAPLKCKKRACKKYGTVFKFASQLTDHEG